MISFQTISAYISFLLSMARKQKIPENKLENLKTRNNLASTVRAR